MPFFLLRCRHSHLPFRKAETTVSPPCVKGHAKPKRCVILSAQRSGAVELRELCESERFAACGETGSRRDTVKATVLCPCRNRGMNTQRRCFFAPPHSHSRGVSPQLRSGTAGRRGCRPPTGKWVATAFPENTATEERAKRKTTKKRDFPEDGIRIGALPFFQKAPL